MKLALVSLAGAAAALFAYQGLVPAPAAHAESPPAAAAPPAGCFRSHDIRNHTFADNKTMYLKVGMKDVYRVTMSSSCLAGAMRNDPLVMREPPGTTMICRPIDMDVSVSKGGFATPCIVESITPMSPAQVEALPRKLRP